MSIRAKQNLFFLFFGLLFFSLSLPYSYAGLGIDPSWTESLVMAINQHFVFGKDFIFNYGPLGYLNTTLLPKNISPWLIFCFHGLLLGHYLFIIKLCFYKLNQNWWQAALIAVLIFLPWGFFSDVTFTLFYLMVFWLIYVHRTANTIPLLIIIILAVLIFYIKVNLSLIAYTVLAGSLIYFSIAKIITWRTTFIVFSVLIVLTYVLSFFLNVSIPAYLAASLKIIDAYQDGQAITILRTKEFLILLFFEFLIVLLVLIHLVKNLAFFTKYIYLYLMIAMIWFLCFKQAHTAVAHYNVFGFFLLLPMLAILIFLFAEQFRGSGKLVVAVLVLQLIATQLIRLSYTQYQAKEYLLFFFPAQTAEEVRSSRNALKLLNTFKEKNPVDYFKRLLAYDYEKNFDQAELNAQRILPTHILKKIGRKSIDIMPWEISYVFLNKLNYNPRPVIQTYQANSDWLAAVNEAKYCSSTAPDFVLANIHDYREQNPIWMDKGAYLALRENYSLTDTVKMPDETLFLFQKKKTVSSVRYQKETQKIGELGKPIKVTNTALNYLKADISYNFAGKISRLLFQPPYLRCLLKYEDGTEESFRIPPPILKGGILINERVTHDDEFIRFVTKTAGNKKINTVTFWTKSAWGFKPNFNYHFERIN